MTKRKSSPTSPSNEAWRAQFRSEFGAALSHSLASRNMTQSVLAGSTGTSPAYVNQTISGSRTVSANWIDLVSSALSLSEQEQTKLHIAAARDKGYKIPDPDEK